MTHEILSELQKELPSTGPGRAKYTRQAFQMLPKLVTPRILDVGCGRGGPTLELARLSGGQVVGLDLDRPSLDTFSQRVEEARLSLTVQAVNCSLFHICFADESFDLIWAEGSIFIIGFEQGLKAWRRLLKADGLVVVHKMVWLRPDPPLEILTHWQQFYPGITTVPKNLAIIPTCRYTPLGHFTLPEESWWLEYYGPLEKRVQNLRPKYAADAAAQAILDREQREIDLFKQYNQWYGSAFFVMQKAATGI
jgi:SAM-dependent methyltransferase